MEARIFGSVADEGAVSSRVQVRVRLLEKGPRWQQFSMKMGSAGAYIWYFASVASDKRRWWKTPPGKANQPPGVPNPEGHLPAGTKFEMQVSVMRQLRPEDQQLWNSALEACLRFGGVGMRLTRGMGAWLCESFPTTLGEAQSAARRLLDPSGITVRFRNVTFTDWEEAIFDAEKWLKNDFRKENNAEKRPESPLGGVRNKPRFRQTSAVYFRPLLLADGRFGLMIFEVPHERVLSQNARTSRPLLENRSFEGNPPEGEMRESRWR